MRVGCQTRKHLQLNLDHWCITAVGTATTESILSTLQPCFVSGSYNIHSCKADSVRNTQVWMGVTQPPPFWGNCPGKASLILSCICSVWISVCRAQVEATWKNCFHFKSHNWKCVFPMGGSPALNLNVSFSSMLKNSYLYTHGWICHTHTNPLTNESEIAKITSLLLNN